MVKSVSKVTHQIPVDKVDASPTKKFFVEMLTRDIDLIDAIMDLIDNSIDGVHRETKNKKIAKNRTIYSNYFAEIKIDENKFEIKDNCGGIPEDVAKNYAFKMGREDRHRQDENLETVGVYGIGMKRAIFKMGKEASVVSHTKQNNFKVSVPLDWPVTEKWLFNFENLSEKTIKKSLTETGTILSITSLHKSIASKFVDKNGFIKDLREKLQQHYGYIIQQGFVIKVNGHVIQSLQLNIISSKPVSGQKAIRPYVYSGIKDDVSIEIVIGFYRPPAESEEVDESLEGTIARSSSDNAGITILCNDRVVLYANKEYITGWGDPPVPSYHTQFINIAGVVHFRSKTPIKLPVTTTKRGVDASSPVYTTARNRIKEGLKYFTAFTNNWKAPSPERAKLFSRSEVYNVLEPGFSKSKNFVANQVRKDDEGKYQLPDLPKPNDSTREKTVSITFVRDKEKFNEILDFYFDGQSKPASEVGGWCFDQAYAQID